MNPILKNRSTLIKYSFAIFSFAIAYAIFFGMLCGMDWCHVWIDALVVGIFCALQGITVRNMVGYVLPSESMSNNKFSIIVPASIMIVGSTVGIEALIMYVCMEEGFELFAQSIPLRLMVTAMVLAIYMLYFQIRRIRTEALESEIVPESKQEAQQTNETPKEVIERITIRGGQNIKVISIEDIEYLQADGDYVAVVTTGGRWLKEQTMKYFEEHLPEDMFVRIHRSYIVGISKIIRIERYGNLYQVVLNGGEKLKVSATGYRILRQKLAL